MFHSKKGNGTIIGFSEQVRNKFGYHMLYIKIKGNRG